MSASSVIISDLKMCFLDGKREFDVLNAYRGVQFMCKGMLESVSENAAVLNIQSPCSVLLEAGKTTLILSSQLLDPIKATVTSFDILTGQLKLRDFAYAGPMIGSRHEYRVEPSSSMEIEIEMDDHKIMGKLADISMSGAGFYVTISEQEAAMFQRGAKVFLTIHLAEGKVRLLGTLRSVERTVDAYRLAAEFTENVPEKVIILHYVTRRQGEIRQEVQKMYEVAYKARLQQA